MRKFDQITEDYSRQPVPDSATVTGLRITVVMVGAVITLPIFFVAAQLGPRWHGAQNDALRDRAPLEGLPAVLACGAFSAAVGIQESSRRFQRLLPGSTLTYIPKSKQWWFVEGKEPCEVVVALLHELVTNRIKA